MGCGIAGRGGGCGAAGSEVKRLVRHVMNRFRISQGGREDGRGGLLCRRARVRAMVLGAALNVLGCGSSDSGQGGSDAGVEVDATASDTRVEVGMTFDQSKCGSCLENSCAKEFSACRQAPPCSTFLICWEACPVSAHDIGNATCAKPCLQGSGIDADVPYQGVDDCVDTQWSGDCQAACTH